jgi:hypothetical protein
MRKKPPIGYLPLLWPSWWSLPIEIILKDYFRVMKTKFPCSKKRINPKKNKILIITIVWSLYNKKCG